MSEWQWCGNVQPHAIHGKCPGVTEAIPTTDENGRIDYYTRIVEPLTDRERKN